MLYIYTHVMLAYVINLYTRDACICYTFICILSYESQAEMQLQPDLYVYIHTRFKWHEHWSKTAADDTI